jgi:hypothetical protein
VRPAVFVVVFLTSNFRFIDISFPNNSYPQ